MATPTHIVWVPAAEDTLVLIASDGLFANEERGGGGGLTNQEAVQLAGQVADADDAARRLSRQRRTPAALTTSRWCSCG